MKHKVYQVSFKPASFASIHKLQNQLADKDVMWEETFHMTIFTETFLGTDHEILSLKKLR